MLTAPKSTAPSSTTVTVTAQSGDISHAATIAASVTPILAGTVPVDLSSAYNITGIYSDGAQTLQVVSTRISLNGNLTEVRLPVSITAEKSFAFGGRVSSLSSWPSLSYRPSLTTCELAL